MSEREGDRDGNGLSTDPQHDAQPLCSSDCPPLPVSRVEYLVRIVCPQRFSVKTTTLRPPIVELEDDSYSLLDVSAPARHEDFKLGRTVGRIAWFRHLLELHDAFSSERDPDDRSSKRFEIVDVRIDATSRGKM